MSRLFIVGTPIGNLSDASERMLDTLRSVELIASEDTRVTAKLCARYHIRTPMVSYHEHNERTRADELVRRMLEKDIDIAVVSDAGMPCISDPGAIIVARARAAGIPVTCVPGPSAAIAALSLSGWEVKSFAFHGFLPREKGVLRAELQRISQQTPIALLYESPRRIALLMNALIDTSPSARVFICNDLTKKFEWTFEGTPEETLDALSVRPAAEKGEYCVALRFVSERIKPKTQISAEAAILEAMLNGLSLNEAILAARNLNISRNGAFKAGLNVKKFLHEYQSVLS